MQHKLYMVNDIHGSWCRTTPLWGRGLSFARNEVEAILWHCYSRKSHAFESGYRFYQLSKEDRDAVVKFLRAI